MKVILVTGGTGEIGSAICRKFAANDYSIVATYHGNIERAQKLRVELKNNDSHILQSPTTDPEAIAKLKTLISEKFGKLDVLVNCAGVTTPVKHDDLEGLSDDWIDRIMKTNFRGSFAMIRAMKDLLLQAKDGALVVNISSIAGIYAMGSNVAYCASKAAMDSMTRSLARALAPKIRVVSVSPGLVEGDYTKNFDPAFLEHQKANTPLGRFVLGEDVANAVYAVATSLTFSTGNIITVDGGRLLK